MLEYPERLLDRQVRVGLHGLAIHTGSHPAGSTSWLTIGAIACSLLIGTTVLMASIAFSFQRYFEYQIEEARKISE